MPTPRCSVLLPVRNAIDTLDECIRSIRRQTLGDYEVVAVDDFSTDGSLARLKQIARDDHRWRIVPSPARGIVAALNAGLSHSASPLVARMDADDVMLPERLAQQCALLDARPELAVVGSRVELIESSVTAAGFREYVRWQNSCVTAAAIDRARYIESPLVHPSVMFRRDVVHQHGGYREGDFAEDYDLWLRLLSRGVAIGKCPEVLLRWRDGPRRLSRTDARCSDESFSKLRASYLARDPRLREARSRLLIWGAGRKTRARAAHLLKLHYAPRAWIDIDQRKIGNIVHGVPVIAPDAITKIEQPFVLSYVRNHGARENIAAALHALHLVEGQHWLSVG